MELTNESDRIDDLNNINIQLKNHQLAMIKRMIDIESINICKLGILNDKPGTGKTYAILGYIYHTNIKPNIIVVPQNIINQWCNSINKFSDGNIKYKKFTEYSEIIQLYDIDNNLFEYDILLTTSLYYNMIATTLNSINLKIQRVFFDEIDSISSFVVNEINCNFAWFVSASFNYDELGIYTTKIDKELLPYITCKCLNKFIDDAFLLPEPQIYKIICKNIYVDNIFYGILTNEEYNILNAMDYSKLKKKFCNKIAQNEKEALDFIVKDKIDIIEIEKIRIEDLNKQLELYKNNIDLFNEKKLNILKKQLDLSTKSLEESNNKLDLIRERLKDNNCCPLCYTEFNNDTTELIDNQIYTKINQKKVLSKCCKNIICYDCTNNWFNNMKKTNCIYCNMIDIKFEDYIILKPNIDNLCRICDKEFESINNKYYSNCCKKNICIDCLKEWYYRLLKQECMICNKEEIMFEDFKNEKEHEEVKLNEKSGIKYTKKTKIEFLEYFIRTKALANYKIIFCSNYIRIFNDIKNVLIKYNIAYIELDDGNINDISLSINKYTIGKINIMLLNSNLFGCGLNLECTTDIVFLHKTDIELEKQIIGRAQRQGRKNKLNIWYLMHENENIINTKKIKKKYDIDIITNNIDQYFDDNIEYNDILFENYSFLN